MRNCVTLKATRAATAPLPHVSRRLTWSWRKPTQGWNVSGPNAPKSRTCLKVGMTGWRCPTAKRSCGICPYTWTSRRTPSPGWTALMNGCVRPERTGTKPQVSYVGPRKQQQWTFPARTCWTTQSASKQSAAPGAASTTLSATCRNDRANCEGWKPTSPGT